MNSGNKISLNLYRTAFGYLFIVAVLGLLLRTLPLVDLSLPYQHILHAHSHTALLGWAFIMSCCSIMQLYDIDFKRHISLFYFITTSIIGMLFSFLYQSYGVISIAFSTFFIIGSYILLYRIYTSLPQNISAKVLKRGIIWFYVSTLGVWALGPTSAILGKAHWLYKILIQFFLHFQVNGWLFYATMGLLITMVSKSHKAKEKFDMDLQKVITALDIGLILGLAPLIYWVETHLFLVILNGISALALAYGLWFLAKIIWKFNLKDDRTLLLSFVSILLIIKSITHLISISPSFLESLAYNRNLIIAYLHLVLLGIVSLTFVYYAMHMGIISKNFYSKMGITLWVIGFLVTETILMIHGLFDYHITYYLELMWLFSFLILGGISILFYQTLTHKKNCPKEQFL